MRTKVAKWGNSLAIRIPKVHADQIGVGDGSAIEIVARGDVLIIKRPARTLETLLAGVTAENLHGETATGKPRGREEW